MIYSAYRPTWHPQDLADLEAQKPSEASYCNTIFDIELSGNMTKRKWNKFAGLITQAFKLVEYTGTFNITVSVPAINVNRFGDNDAAMNRLGKLRGIQNANPPVPACWDWTVVIQFEKFPYWNQVEDYMQTVERAIYGIRFNEIERKYRGSIIKFEITG